MIVENTGRGFQVASFLDANGEVIRQRTGHSYYTIKKHMYREKKKKEADGNHEA